MRKARFLKTCLLACGLALVLGVGAVSASTTPPVFVYVAQNTKVVVYDASTNTAVATISGTGARNLSFSRDGSLLFSATSNAVQVIDVATNTIVANVPTGNIMAGVAQAANGRIYTCNNASATVSVIDPSTYTVIDTLSSFCPTIAATPDGSAIWVPTVTFGPTTVQMAIIDPATDTFTLFPLTHGLSQPNAIAFTADGALAYLAIGSVISVVDTATHNEVAAIPIPGVVSQGIALSPDGTRLYVANLTQNNVSVIDTATNTVVATVPVGSLPRTLAVTPDGAFVYVTNFSSSTVSVIDTATNTVSTTFSAPSFPWGVAITPNHPPVAKCQDVTVSAGPSCSANASIDNGSFDPDAGDSITLAQSPAGPFGLGATNVTLTATDSFGRASSCTAKVTVVDTTPPAITCPAPITVNGCLSSGVSVSFTVTATDSCDASPTIVTAPPSGSLFAVGTTPVTATATDHSGNSTQCGFTVTVLSSQDQIAALTTQINALVAAGSLSQSDANPLLNTLSNAAKHLANGQVSQTQKEIADLIKKVAGDVQTGKLAPATGQALIDAAQAFGANLGC